MVANYSSKRIRDAEAFARWDALSSDAFDQVGFDLAQLKALQTALHGFAVFRGDPGYEDGRMISNPIFNSYPDLIIYCKTEADVSIALAFGQIDPNGFCLRSGGHCTAGYSTGSGVLIDLKSLDGIKVDNVKKVATVDCGATFGALFQVLNQMNLTVPGGECPDVCVAGYVQGGGYGFTSCTYGMSCDNVLSMRVMLADGTIVTASSTENADLFWAMRGGTGGNFGILLSLEFELYDIGQVGGFALAWPLDSAAAIDQAADVMMSLQTSYMLNSVGGNEMTMQISLCFQNWVDTSQPKPPPNTPMKPYLMVRGMWLGQYATLAPLVAPLAAMPGCINQWIAQDSFFNMNDKLLNYPQGMPLLDSAPFEDKLSRYVDKSLTKQDYTDLLALFATAPVNMAYGYAEFYGGTINTKGALDTAFVHRNVAFNMVMDVYWQNVSDRSKCEKFLYDWRQILDPMSNGHVYQNYPSPSATNYADEYWGDAYPTLQQVKQKYDPKNAFTYAQQVKPPTGAYTAPAGLPASVTAALSGPITCATQTNET